MGEKLCVVIPAYNEEANIEKVVLDWYPVVEKYGEESKLLIIDDGSKDGTYQKLMELVADRPALIVRRKENGGHGSAVLCGYYYALELRGGVDYIFQTDSDGQTSAEEFPPFWDKRNFYDMIIGKRNHRKDGIIRIFVTKILRLLLRVIFGVWIPDANTPFRLMKREMLENCLKIMPENYNLPNVIISVMGAKRQKKVLYIPISFNQRQGGINSINLKNIVGIGIQAIRDFWQINQQITEENV